MAARTSQQSGNFTASATWGGTPADGDTFTISAGHSVTSSTINMPTCLLYTSPSPRDDGVSRMPSSA